MMCLDSTGNWTWFCYHHIWSRLPPIHGTQSQAKEPGSDFATLLRPLQTTSCADYRGSVGLSRSTIIDVCFYRKTIFPAKLSLSLLTNLIRMMSPDLSGCCIKPYWKVPWSHFISTCNHFLYLTIENQNLSWTWQHIFWTDWRHHNPFHSCHTYTLHWEMLWESALNPANPPPPSSKFSSFLVVDQFMMDLMMLRNAILV